MFLFYMLYAIAVPTSKMLKDTKLLGLAEKVKETRLK